MTAVEKWTKIQAIIGTIQDGFPGPNDTAALASLRTRALQERLTSTAHTVRASAFAYRQDIVAFQACKARGGTDQECFKVGDNGIGVWHDDTTSGTKPMCALPPEDWKPFEPNARGKLVLVKARGKEIICELRDTMPARANIKNGAGIDLNPGACLALGLVPGPSVMVDATWQWV
jgi:hypothetical protein